MIYQTKPLQWGQTEEEIKKKYPHVCITKGKIRVGSNCTLTNFPGDCGALILNYANHATTEDLRTAIKIASGGGFNKIFATVCMERCYYKFEEVQKAFKKNRFLKVKEGTSNRNPHKADIVYVKYITNCKYKGY